VLECAPEATVLVSHANARTLAQTPRNLDDQQIRAVAARDGVVGVLAHPFVLEPGKPTIDGLIDHIDYIADLVGVEHVGLGGDFMRQIVRSGTVRSAPGALLPDGIELDAAVEGLAGPEDYPALAAALAVRGYDGDRRAAVLGENWLRVFRRGLP
jgi:membrane dipeptidase